MTRRQALALSLAGVVITPSGASAIAQSPVGLSRGTMPGRESLARLGLVRAWYAAVPLGYGTEHIQSMNLAEDTIFVQTDRANLHAYDSETGKYMWGANIGSSSIDAQPVSVNSNLAFISNGPELFALDRRTGRLVWKARMDGSAVGATAANEDRVVVGLAKGSLVAFNVKDRTKAKPPGRSAGTFSWTWQTRAAISARPLPAGKVVAFASQDSRVYVAEDDTKTILFRFLTGGPIVGSLGALGTRTIVAPSMDGSLYAIDLFTGEKKWIISTGSPFNQEPFIDRDTVFAINQIGRIIAVDGTTGTLLWSEGTGGGKVLAVGATRLYLLSHDGDLAIVDRATGRAIASPRETKDRAGLNLREFPYAFSNDQNDRMFFATKSGFLMCLHDVAQIQPRTLKDPAAKPFGYVPAGGEPKTIAPTPEAEEKPAEGEAKP
jgi:outer membrane protein assembly factor BamB